MDATFKLASTKYYGGSERTLEAKSNKVEILNLLEFLKCPHFQDKHIDENFDLFPLSLLCRETVRMVHGEEGGGGIDERRRSFSQTDTEQDNIAKP